eukprot:6807803-Ditylum_brightwellii.AAC.1
MMHHDRKLYPKQYQHHKGELVFSCHPAQKLLCNDVIAKLHESITPSKLCEYQSEYKGVCRRRSKKNEQSKKHNEDLFDAILTAYHKFKEMTVATGKEAEPILDTYSMVKLEDLNTLYFVTAITFSPLKVQSEGQKRVMPDNSYEKKLLKSIEYLCKKQGNGSK